MFIIIVFWLGCDRLSGLLSLVPALLFFVLAPVLSSLSVPLSYFSLAVPMRECLGKHSCMSSPCHIAILNDTWFFLSLVQEKLNMPSGHYYRLCSWSGRSNHLIKLKLIGGWAVGYMAIRAITFSDVSLSHLLRYFCSVAKTTCPQTTVGCAINNNRMRALIVWTGLPSILFEPTHICLSFFGIHNSFQIVN